jgi:MHS family shikimate/dehydroshikimate transporter-like MFS transporter
VSLALQGSSTLLEARKTTGRVVLHSFLALSAQWYDSMALVVLGPQLASALLPADMPQLQQLHRLFGAFAVGHVLWLLGCFLWPAKAAKLGRKALLLWTMSLSGFCTALVGCMPSYAEVRAYSRCRATQQLVGGRRKV